MSIVAFAGIMVMNLRVKSFYNEAYKNMQLQLEIKEGMQNIAVVEKKDTKQKEEKIANVILNISL